jgi:predicted PurR-regulated permease PerM
VTSEELKLPFYAKIVIFIVGLIALIMLLYIAKGIIIPLVFATIFAILLNPLVNFLVRLKINRVLAIAFTLLLTFLILVAFGALVMSQVNRLSDSMPSLVDKFTIMLDRTISEASDYFEINPQKIHDWITKTQNELINISTAAIGQTIVIMGSALVVLFLLPVYIFLLLFYEPLLLEFIHKLFGDVNQIKVGAIVMQTKTVIQNYLIGLVIEAVIIAAMDTTALLVLGVEYALLLGIIGALLNVIPYIGGLVAVALPMAVALATKSSPYYALYILVFYYIIQLIDNNYIVPKIVASKVKINALFSIIVVIVGNAIWGIPGMFLSIPLLAIFKVICDNIEPMKPWGFLLGDTMPPIIKIKTIFKKRTTISG